MATIPQAVDLGARPSLRSSRVDIPSGGMEQADALANAAATFANVMSERRQKQDAFRYANAKNDLLLADIQAREALKEDQDWATYNERYRTAMTEALNASSAAIRNDHDRAIFDAESRLVIERGAVQVGDYGRTVEIDEKAAGLEASLSRSRESIILADPGTRNDMLMTVRDQIDAARAEGWLDDVRGETMAQAFTQDVAMATLVSMDPEDRQKALEASLAYRTGGPLTPDDIRAGKGTGSIADFMHADVAAQLLEKTKAENKTTNDRIAAFAVVDESFAQFPMEYQAADRARYIRENTEGDIRAVAESALRSRNQDQENESLAQRRDIVNFWSERMENDAMRYDDIPAKELEMLTPQEKTYLRDYDQNRLDGREFAERTDWDKWGAWMELSDSAKMDVDLTSAEWKTTMDAPTWRSMLAQQEQITSAAESGSGGVIDYGATDEQLYNRLVEGMNFLPASRNEADESRYQQGLWAFTQAVDAARQSEFGGGRIPEERRREILLQLMSQQAYTRGGGIPFVDLTRGDPEPVLFMTEKQRRRGFIPIEEVRAVQTTQMVNGVPVQSNWADVLKNLARAELDGYSPSDKQIENAYFAIVAGLDDAEVLRRLRD